MFESKVTAVVLAVLTAWCVFVAGVNVLGDIWERSIPYKVTMCHAGLACLIEPATALMNFILLAIVGIGWLANVRNPFFLRRTFAAVFVVLLASAISLIPSHPQYRAAAVLLLGPGPSGRR